MSKNTALQKIESHEKLCRIMQKQTHQKINKLEVQIDRIEKILLTCAGTLLVGMGGVITALVLNT
jgi:hypothetical protein